MGVMTLRTGLTVAIVCALLASLPPSSGWAAQTVAPAHELRVDLTEWAAVPSHGVVSAGPLRLKIANAGRLFHELEIVPTRTWGEPLRVRDGRAVGEPAARPIVVAPGKSHSAWVVLRPGFYVLVDNIPGHYAAGAAVSIVVL